MKKLSLLLLAFLFVSLSSAVRDGLSDMRHGARRVFEGAAEVVTAPFDGGVWEEDAEVVYDRDVERAKNKRDRAREARKERGEKSGWFKDAPEDKVYKKEVKQAKEKRDRKRKEQKERQREEARSERA